MYFWVGECGIEIEWKATLGHHQRELTILIDGSALEGPYSLPSGWQKYREAECLSLTPLW